MLTITLKTDLPERLSQAQQNIERGLPSLLQEVGVYLLQRQRFSFEAKSRGGVGDDGVKWKPLAESTEIKKARKAKGFRAARAKVRKLKGQLGKATTAAQRQRIRDKMKTASAATAVPRSQIGVDTGILRNCVTPGYRAPDGNGGNVMQVTGNRVALKYDRSYAAYFDDVRPLFPPDDRLPKSWLDGVEQIVNEWIDEQVKGIR